MRKVNPISYLWDEAYSRICSLATEWCADGMPDSALDELYAFSESVIVTDLQLEADEKQEAIHVTRFEEAFHTLSGKYAEEFVQAKERVTEAQMEQFLSGNPMRDRFAKVAQQIKTQRAKIRERMKHAEIQMQAVSSREERDQLSREFLYLAHQAGAWSEELLQRIKERI